jgi:hypothetical protein
VATDAGVLPGEQRYNWYVKYSSGHLNFRGWTHETKLWGPDTGEVLEITMKAGASEETKKFMKNWMVLRA